MTYFALFSIINFINSLFFELSTSEEKCFVDELLVDNVLFIKYKLYDVTNKEDITKIQLRISKEGNDTPLAFHTIKRITGKHSFTAKENGNYKICAFMTGSLFNRVTVKMRLRFDSDGTEDKDLSEVLQHSGVSKSLSSIRRIVTTGKSVIGRQKANIDREDKHSHVHVNYSRTFIYITIAQIIIVFGIGIYNIISFRNFLIQKNII